MESDSTNYSRLRSFINSASSRNTKFQIDPPSNVNVNSMPKIIMLFLIAGVIILIPFIIITSVQILVLKSKNSFKNSIFEQRNSTLLKILQSSSELDIQLDNQLSTDGLLLKETNQFNEISSILIDEINLIKAKLSPNYRHFMDQLLQSSIIQNEDELIALIKWLPQSNMTAYENIKLNLIYKGLRDGDQLLDFHSRIDFKSPLVVIAKTKEDHFRFGAFTMQNFYSENPVIQVNDPYTFFFSFDSMKTYEINNYFTGIITGSDVFINFGNVFTIKQNWSHDKNKGLLTYTFCLEVTNERFPYKKTLFTPEEIEVYQVSTINRSLKNGE